MFVRNNKGIINKYNKSYDFTWDVENHGEIETHAVVMYKQKNKYLIIDPNNSNYSNQFCLYNSKIITKLRSLDLFLT